MMGAKIIVALLLWFSLCRSIHTNIIIKETEGCEVSTNKDFPTHQSLLLMPKDLDGRGPGIYGFYLPQTKDLMRFDFGQEVILACPGKGNYVVATGNKNEMITCLNGKNFQLSNGSIHAFSTLGCITNPVPTFKRHYSGCNLASNNDDYHAIQIGFEIDEPILGYRNFYALMDTCFNINKTFQSIVSGIGQTPSIAGIQKNYPSPPNFFQEDMYPPGINVTYLYSKKSQIDQLTKILGSSELANHYIHKNDNFFLARGHLTAKNDFALGVHQETTFNYLNVVPQWQTLNIGNWRAVEADVRKYVVRTNYTVESFTGIHGVTTLPDIQGVQQPLYLAHLDDGRGILPVPHLVWKALKERRVGGIGIAILGLNNPYIAAPGPDFYLCPDICNEIPWLTSVQRDNQTAGFITCCRLSDLKGVIEEMPLVF